MVVADVPSMDAAQDPGARRASSGAMEIPGKVLILTDGKNENVYLSARNLKNVSVLAVRERVGLRRALGPHGGHRAQRG